MSKLYEYIPQRISKIKLFIDQHDWKEIRKEKLE